MSKYRISTNTKRHGIILVDGNGNTRTIYTTHKWAKLVIRLNQLLEREQNPKPKRKDVLPKPSQLEKTNNDRTKL